MNAINQCVLAHVRGRVQGVGFRYFTLQAANDLNLFGWVKNLPNGDVEALAVGPESALHLWLEHLKKGPPLSKVDALNVQWLDQFDTFTEFRII